MIEKYFPSKRQTQQPWTGWQGSHTNLIPMGHQASAFEQARADKMGDTIEVYRQRVSAVLRESNGCRLQIGDTVWPVKYKDFQKHGKCMVTGICRNYDEYGTVDWNDPPFILTVAQLNDREQTIQCTVGWVTNKQPTFVTEPQGEC